MSQEWQTDAFRGSLVRKLEEAIRDSGNQTNKNAVEMEKQVFQRAKSKEEYLSFVARLDDPNFASLSRVERKGGFNAP